MFKLNETASQELKTPKEASKGPIKQISPFLLKTTLEGPKRSKLPTSQMNKSRKMIFRKIMPEKQKSTSSKLF